MINVVLSAITFIVTIFYLKKRRNVKYSLVKTIIFFTATICVGTFFYKTNQIVELGYCLTINAFKSSVSKDTTEKVILDTIPSIELTHNLESSFYNNGFKRIRNNHIDIQTTIEPPKNISYFTKKIRSDNDVNSACTWLNVHPQQLARIYEVKLELTYLPSINPIRKSKMNTNKPSLNNYIYGISRITENCFEAKGLYRPDFEELFKDDKDLLDSIRNAYDKQFIPNGLQQVYSECSLLKACDNKAINKNIPFTGSLSGFLFDFFTAADISQYIMSITVHSDCQINNIRFTFDIPVEVPSIYSDLESGTYGFGLPYSRIQSIMVDGAAHHIYVKLPSMANLQLVRSFILTTLLTALLTLFLTSFISTLKIMKQRIAKYINKKIFKNEANVETELIIKEERIFSYILLIFSLIVAIPSWYLCYRLYNDNPIILTVDDIDKLNSIILAITLPFVACLSYLYVIVWYKNNKKINKTI